MADATTTTTYTGPDPGLGQYGILQGQAEKTYADTQAQLATQRTSLLGNSGLVDNGTGGWQVDPNNQSGTYQIMNNQLAGQGAADDAAIGAMGFGGGISQHAREMAQQGYGATQASWLDNLTNGQGGLQDLKTQGVNAGQKRSGDEFQALMSDIQTAIANNQFNPANYSGIKIDGYDVQGDLAGLAPSTVADTSGAFTAPGSGSGGGMHGGVQLSSHPHYAAAVKAGFKGNYNQWVAQGKPKGRH